MQNMIYMVRGRTMLERRARTGYLFILPLIFFVTILFIIPTGYNLILSFSNWSLTRPMTFAGLENYLSVLTSDRFWNSLRQTFYFAALGVPVTIVLALATALGFHRLGQLIGTSVVRALYFMPVVASLTAVAYIWMWIFNPFYGIANAVLQAVGLPALQWLTNQQQVIPALSIMYIWARVGFNMLILLAGLTAIPQDYYEAAQMDGPVVGHPFGTSRFPC